MSKAKIGGTDRHHNDDNTANVLVIDDDPEVAAFLLKVLARRGIRGSLARDSKTANELIEQGDTDLVFVGESMLGGPSADGSPPSVPDGRTRSCFGGSLLRKVREHMPELPVIAISGAGKRQPQCDDGKAVDLRRTIAKAVEAMRIGCCDFLIKPLEPAEVDRVLDTFIPCHKVCAIDSAQENSKLLYRIVGRSAKLAHTVELARKIAPTSAPVLITGESGTGKELISYLVHRKSKRAEGPYVKVNCAALSDTLLESELFGHEKGAFTGAYSRRRGRFEMAHGGTLLLDEITETPAKFQAKLLRVLEQQDFERVGGNENIRVRVRIISTTNKDLSREVQNGSFRLDLYYRLSGVRLIISPLRQRKEDLPDLVWYFVNIYARQSQRRITRLDPLMMEVFSKYHWPGNVRQLRSVVRTCLILGSGQTLSLVDVPWLFDGAGPVADSCESENGQMRRPTECTCDAQGNERLAPSLSQGLAGVSLAQIERRAILDTLRQTAGNQTKAAKVLGISDRTLRDRLRRYRRQGCLQSA